VSDPNLCTNRVPEVQPPSPLTVDEGAHVQLTAVASDPDGDAVTLAFAQVAGPQITVTNGAFTAPEVTADTELDFEIVASDGRATSASVTQKVTVRDVNKPPVAVVTPSEITVDEGTAVQ